MTTPTMMSTRTRTSTKTPMTDLDQAERIRRLQERRAAGRRGPTADPGADTTARPPARQERTAGGDDGTTPAVARRHHPAAASRIGAAGLGATLTLSLVGAISLTDTTPASSETTQPPSTTSSVPAVLVPIRHTIHLVTGTGGSGDWTGRPGTGALVNSPGNSGSTQPPSSSTNGSK